MRARLLALLLTSALTLLVSPVAAAASFGQGYSLTKTRIHGAYVTARRMGAEHPGEAAASGQEYTGLVIPILYCSPEVAAAAPAAAAVLALLFG